MSTERPTDPRTDGEVSGSSRRAFVSLAGGLAATAAFPARAAEPTLDEHLRTMSALPPDAPVVAMLVHPQMVLLDLAGPLTIFDVARFRTQLVWRDRAPVRSIEGVPLAADWSFDDCPAQIDVLFVPGGIMGTIACMNDPTVMRFLADRGSRARWVTGICTGSLMIAAAGLLDGYDATAYWPVADLLPLMGARHVDRRVVTDRNRMTGAGVTAGIDFALTLVGAIQGEEAARRVQLTIEYAPAPPFDAGTPGAAGPALASAMRASRHPMDAQARLAAEAAGRRLRAMAPKGS